MHDVRKHQRIEAQRTACCFCAKGMEDLLAVKGFTTLAYLRARYESLNLFGPGCGSFESRFVASSSAKERCACEKSAPIIGRVEYVVMEDVRMKLKARIDTGAGVSSIDAKIVEIKPAADGSREKVTFQIKDDEGKIKSLEQRSPATSATRVFEDGNYQNQ